MDFAKSLNAARQLSDSLHFLSSQPPRRFVPYAMHPPANDKVVSSGRDAMEAFVTNKSHGIRI
jgi:hypothetical protein